MFYYIYYGYIGGYTVYKLYEYTHMLRYGYNTVYYTYSFTYGIYDMLTSRTREDEEGLDDWEHVERKNENII